MSHLHRTQIYIEDEQMSRLKLEAAKAKVAVSELIRRAIDASFQEKGKQVNWDNDPLTKAAGKIKLTHKDEDASIRHDFYLYGEGSNE